MTRYGLRARVITLTLAPTLIIGLLLSTFFTLNRYNDLETQLITSGTDIIEPLAIASEYGMTQQSREAVRRLISYAHRKHSDIVRSIAVFDTHHELFVTSNFHPNFQSLTFDKSKPIPLLSSITQSKTNPNLMILRSPILAEGQFTSPSGKEIAPNQALGYIAMELDLSSLRLQQYQEIFAALIVLLLGMGLSGFFAYRLMRDVTLPISHMVSVVDRIRRGHLDVRIEGKLHGELDTLKSGINAMAMSLSEYHVEMQHSIDQATSDLRETLEQLEIQNIELDIAKKRAQEAARVKSEFLANMSHELRTPLNGVIGFARQMLKTELTANQIDYLQTIERSAQNLLSIINDILDFSKLEAGKLLLENIPFDLQETLDEVVSLQATSAHEKGLEITLNIDSNIPQGMVGDPLRIQQVLTNLVGNAIKFTERGNIDIVAELRSSQDKNVEVQFMVRDTGIGISERQQAQLFQAFSQADASISRRYGGTGLGLVITQNLVNQMGGEISLTSRLHQGSTFWFSVTFQATNMPIAPQIDTSSLQDKSVLLVEPNMPAAAIIEQQLTRVGMKVTYQAQLADNPERFDIVLLNLPANIQHDQSLLFAMIQQGLSLSPQLILGLPSTELALAENLIKLYPIQCIAKPIVRRKLIQLMLPNQAKSTLLAAPQPPTAALPLKVMAVDDNPANLKLICALLEEQVEDIVTCSSGSQAVEQAQLQKFDVILMDIQMPDMDGVTACQNIKKTEFNHQTPVIAVTAHAIDGERERLLQAGMDDYLSKPIEEHVLHQALVHWNPYAEQGTIEKLDLKESQLDSIPAVSTSQQATISGIGGSSIDWSTALKQAANKEALAKDMLQMLIEFLPEVDESIEKALIEPNEQQNQLLATIHKLHGSCAYSGVPKLQTLCATIETALRAEQDLAEIEPELFELQDEMEKVKEDSKQYLVR
ncbi:two-component sensor histidine kinase BarA [Vibrio sp. CK2-1]|uniref:two-component sensor histidine kinase BarA n=1 Tax=Vibrio sp. CK2-1 TaxID=2912249 RepID=UPI001F00D725|nr:two-component sensor histidine kinase BarA [Vibrio sp. CK2-1]MCF7353940.1 two-component sensor histidine kinase BarA [Vibrio sp. CK2-1]